ncbi:hypothetical protein A5753_18605 [Mycobacterium sp. 852002-51971_SCH5477799-a]|uniref:hypothetical protein n=1 Tax=Mycobacterium sp. 852002-51971_SCH5477799-a TaxID=1834106 RepID=UPI0007FD1369|nr:hypothetical protein [Mycobacterium sp. 852002-51971_SCH5477799-a]OBF61248.1 hypothetical protein A5753_18605 [Mycobacterium sp. 852002-51971_SCH5477799-a]
MALQARVAALAVVAMLVLSGCSVVVGGRAVRASGQSGAAPSAPVKVRAQDLLLHSGDDTPFGAATPIPVSDNYFVTAQPPNCEAAVLFENSPLRPPGASEHAESAYRFAGPATYGESVDLYGDPLDVQRVVVDGFIAIAQCRREAVGVSRDGQSASMHLSDVDTSSRTAVVWTMTQPGWICDYGLAALPRVVLLLSACDAKPGFPMADWTSKRLAQISGRTA